MTRPFDAQLARSAAITSQCKGILLEGEIPAHRPEAVDWIDVVYHLSDLDIYKGCVTNFAPFVYEDGKPWPEKAAPLIQDGWACVTECFVTEAPNATPDNTNWYATRNLGWATTQPMIEAWHISDYGDLSKYKNVSHWDAGNIGPTTLRRSLSREKAAAMAVQEWILERGGVPHDM